MISLEPPPAHVQTLEAVDVWWTLALAGRAAEYPCLAEIIARESGWNRNAVGDNGASVGLGQRHVPTHGAPPQPWLVPDQTRWMMAYADARYGGICAAWAAWQQNRLRYGWGWW